MLRAEVYQLVSRRWYVMVWDKARPFVLLFGLSFPPEEWDIALAVAHGKLRELGAPLTWEGDYA